MTSMKKTDMTLDVEDVTGEELSHAWGVLTRVAEGLALEGHNVSVQLHQWNDEDEGDDQLVLDGPANDGKDQP